MLETINFSKMFTWSTCQRKYRYIYVEKIKRPPGVALIFGSTSHSAQEYAYKEKMKSGVRPPLKDTKEVFADTLDSNIKGDGIVYKEGESRDMMQDQGLTAIEHYEPEAKKITPIAIEQAFEIQLKGEPYIVNGRMDLVEKNRISDLKFSKYAPNKWDPKYQTQLGIYRWADRLQNGKTKGKKIGIHNIRRGGVRDTVKIIDVPTYIPEKQLVENVVETARAIMAAEQSGFFPKVLDQQRCSWCQYRDLCGLPIKK